MADTSIKEPGARPTLSGTASSNLHTAMMTSLHQRLFKSSLGLILTILSPCFYLYRECSNKYTGGAKGDFAGNSSFDHLITLSDLRSQVALMDSKAAEHRQYTEDLPVTAVFSDVGDRPAPAWSVPILPDQYCAFMLKVFASTGKYFARHQLVSGTNPFERDLGDETDHKALGLAEDHGIGIEARIGTNADAPGDNHESLLLGNHCNRPSSVLQNIRTRTSSLSSLGQLRNACFLSMMCFFNNITCAVATDAGEGDTKQDKEDLDTPAKKIQHGLAIASDTLLALLPAMPVAILLGGFVALRFFVVTPGSNYHNLSWTFAFISGGVYWAIQDKSTVKWTLDTNNGITLAVFSVMWINFMIGVWQDLKDETHKALYLPLSFMGGILVALTIAAVETPFLKDEEATGTAMLRRTGNLSPLGLVAVSSLVYVLLRDRDDHVARSPSHHLTYVHDDIDLEDFRDSALDQPDSASENASLLNDHHNLNTATDMTNTSAGDGNLRRAISPGDGSEGPIQASATAGTSPQSEALVTGEGLAWNGRPAGVECFVLEDDETSSNGDLGSMSASNSNRDVASAA